MSGLLYYGIIFPISLLPMAILYRVSDLLFLLIYYGAGYRKKVVLQNIRQSFPERTEEEHQAIGREFYRHFCDLIVESFKGFTISESEIQKRFRFLNPELLDGTFAKGQSAMLIGGHYGNWEWLAVGIPGQMKHRGVAVYKPLSNLFFDAKMRETRGRFGLEMIPIPSVPEFFRCEAEMKGAKKPFLAIFGIDQSPGDPRKAHWTTFLGQDTGVPFGAEKYTILYDLPVFFGVIHKEKRGHYSFRIQKILESGASVPHGWILEEGSRLLEEEIRRVPPYWLWSHRRWKHRKPTSASDSR